MINVIFHNYVLCLYSSVVTIFALRVLWLKGLGSNPVFFSASWLRVYYKNVVENWTKNVALHFFLVTNGNHKK